MPRWKRWKKPPPIVCLVCCLPMRGRACAPCGKSSKRPKARMRFFAKAIDRIQVPITNLANGGGTWTEYRVTLEQLEARVGTKVSLGAPDVWDWLRPQLHAHFAVI